MNLPIELKTRIYNHISTVQNHLGELPPDEQREILQSLETHIHDALENRAEGNPTIEQLEAILAEMDPPESYGPAQQAPATHPHPEKEPPAIAAIKARGNPVARLILVLVIVFISFFIIMAGVIALYLMASYQPPTAALSAQTSPVGSWVSGNQIIAGVGYGAFKVGASREVLIAALGTPDESSTDKWLQWKKDKYIHCLVDENRGAYELRFDKGFEGKTSKGIRIGSMVEQVISAYGEPKHLTDKGSAKMLEWSALGILMWISDQGVTQIVVFKPRK